MIYRDIKPENFLIEIGKNGNCIYITDLGLASEYRFYRAYIGVLPFNPYLLGTIYFVNINGYLGIDKLFRLFYPVCRTSTANHEVE